MPRGTLPRVCSRPTCSVAASVTLTYAYARSRVWLDDLTVDTDPYSYDMCAAHAERLLVPQGWRLDDRRDRARVTLVAV